MRHARGRQQFYIILILSKRENVNSASEPSSPLGRSPSQFPWQLRMFPYSPLNGMPPPRSSILPVPTRWRETKRGKMSCLRNNARRKARTWTSSFEFLRVTLTARPLPLWLNLEVANVRACEPEPFCRAGAIFWPAKRGSRLASSRISYTLFKIWSRCCLPPNVIIKLLWRITAMVCKNLQLNDCLVAQQLKNMVFIVQGNLGFISVL